MEKVPHKPSQDRFRYERFPEALAWLSDASLQCLVQRRLN